MPNLNVEVMAFGNRYIEQKTVAIGSSSAASSAVSQSAEFIRVAADSPCHIEIGAAPTATTSSRRLAPRKYRDIPIAGGQKIATIGAA